MTLSINVYKKDTDGNLQRIKFEPENHHLGGFELSRHEFWGHPIMMDLGLKILPQLADGAYLQIEGNKLDILEYETIVIRKNTAVLVEITNYNEDFVTFHTDNILFAIGKARKVDGMFTMG